MQQARRRKRPFRSLHLGHNELGRGGALLRALSAAAGLKSLNLHCALDGAAALNPLPDGLEELDLTMCQARGEVVVPAALRRLVLCWNTHLTAVTCAPGRLEVLSANGCSGLTALPAALPPTLRELRLGGAGGVAGGLLPPLPLLEVLDLCRCRLAALPFRAADVPSLRRLDLNSNRELPASALVGLRLPRLEKLDLGGIAAGARLAGVSLRELTPALKDLELRFCSELEALPPLPVGLGHLGLRGCSSLRALPGGLERLKSLEADGGGLGDLAALEGLEELRLDGGVASQLPGGLRRLSVMRAPGFSFAPLSSLAALEELEVRSCELQALPADMASWFPRLRVLDVTGNPALVVDAGMRPVPQLEEVRVARVVGVPAGVFPAAVIKSCG